MICGLSSVYLIVFNRFILNKVALLNRDVNPEGLKGLESHRT